MRRRTKTRLKRLFRNAAMVALIPPAALLAFRLAWGEEASHRLAKAREQLRAAGIPTSESDLPDPAKIPADQDAVAPFLKALSEFDLTRTEREAISPLGGLDIETIVPSDLQAVDCQTVFQGHQRAFQDFDLAASRHQFAWPTSYSFYLGRRPFSWSPALDASRLLAELAIIDAQQHHDTEALQNIRRILSTSYILDQNSLLKADLVAAADSLFALQTTERLLPVVDWSHPDTQTTGRLLLADFQNAFSSGGFSSTWSGEAVFLDTIVANYRPARFWLLASILDDDEAMALRYYAAQLPAASARNYPQSKSLTLAAPARRFDRLSALVHPLTMGMTDPSEVYLMHARATAASRAACILLASYLYRQAHGQFPKVASELVPEFFASVPLDPYAAADRPLRYRLDASGPSVWSVGENGTDDGARFVRGKNPVRFYGQPDFVFGAAWRDHVVLSPAGK